MMCSPICDKCMIEYINISCAQRNFGASNPERSLWLWLEYLPKNNKMCKLRGGVNTLNVLYVEGDRVRGRRSPRRAIKSVSISCE